MRSKEEDEEEEEAEEEDEEEKEDRTKKTTLEDINHPLANLPRPCVKYARTDICSSAGIFAPT